MQYGKSFGNSIYKSDGTKLVEGDGGVITIANSTTYYVPLGNASAPLESAHFQWSAPVVATITIETSNFDEVTIYSSTAGEWIQENPSTAYVGVTGGSASSATITTSAAGGCMYHLGNIGSRRTRAKIVVTTGGTLRITQHGKA